jgi:hypothetical protein
MKLSFRAMASTVVLSGALCLTATGTAQAINGNFTCAYTSYKPSAGSVSTSICWGGPGDATSGTLTDDNTQARYQCGGLLVTPFGSFYYRIVGSQCTPF